LRIVVLAKPVPDTTGQERLSGDLRVDRERVPSVVNANDEYALEAALKLVEAHGGEVELLAMAPAGGVETLRKALAMGAHRGTIVTDDALPGSDAISTARVLAAALQKLDYDLVLAGADTSDGGGGIVPPAVAAHLGLPYLSYAARIEPDPGSRTVRVHRISPTGHDVIEAPMPALIACTQALGAPRYPSLKGIMAARGKEIDGIALADLSLASVNVGGAVAGTRVTEVRPPTARGATRIVRGPADEAAREVVAFLAERRIV
jgi:electron transfer flavoprotein beta subunit